MSDIQRFQIFFTDLVSMVALTDNGLQGKLNMSLDLYATSTMKMSLVQGANISQFIFLLSFGAPLDICIYDSVAGKSLMSLGKFVIKSATISQGVFTFKMTQSLNICKAYLSTSFSYTTGESIIRKILSSSKLKSAGLQIGKISALGDYDTYFYTTEADSLQNIQNVLDCFLDDGTIYNIYQKYDNTVNVSSQKMLSQQTTTFAFRDATTVLDDPDKLDDGIKETSLMSIKTIIPTLITFEAGKDELLGRSQQIDFDTSKMTSSSDWLSIKNKAENNLPIWKGSYYSYNALLGVKDTTFKSFNEKMRALTSRAKLVSDYLRCDFDAALSGSTDYSAEEVDKMPKLAQTVYVCVNKNPASFFSGAYLVHDIAYSSNGVEIIISYHGISNHLNTDAKATGYTNDMSTAFII